MGALLIAAVVGGVLDRLAVADTGDGFRADRGQRGRRWHAAISTSASGCPGRLPPCAGLVHRPGRTDIGPVLQLVLNIANIALDAWFVLAFG